MLDPRDTSRPHPRSVGHLSALFALFVAATGCPSGGEDSPTSATAGDDPDTTSTSLTASDGDPDDTDLDPSDTDGSMSTTDPSTDELPPECGDGNLDPDKGCDLGDDNSDEIGGTGAGVAPFSARTKDFVTCRRPDRHLIIPMFRRRRVLESLTDVSGGFETMIGLPR